MTVNDVEIDRTRHKAYRHKHKDKKKKNSFLVERVGRWVFAKESDNDFNF